MWRHFAGRNFPLEGFCERLFPAEGFELGGISPHSRKNVQCNLPKVFYLALCFLIVDLFLLTVHQEV